MRPVINATNLRLGSCALSVMFHGTRKILHETLQNYINTSSNNNNNNTINNNNDTIIINNNNNDDDNEQQRQQQQQQRRRQQRTATTTTIRIIIILIDLNFFSRHQQRCTMKRCNQVRGKRYVPEMWTCHRWRGRRLVVTIYLPSREKHFILSFPSRTNLAELLRENDFSFCFFFQGNLRWILKVDEFRIDWILEGK